MHIVTEKDNVGFLDQHETYYPKYSWIVVISVEQYSARDWVKNKRSYSGENVVRMQAKFVITESWPSRPWCALHHVHTLRNESLNYQEQHHNHMWVEVYVYQIYEERGWENSTLMTAFTSSSWRLRRLPSTSWYRAASWLGSSFPWLAS